MIKNIEIIDNCIKTSQVKSSQDQKKKRQTDK